MEKKVFKFIKENSMIEEGEKVLVALSGGPDSVCLLHILHKLKDFLNIEIYAAHVNHCLRGESAIKDEEYAKILCENLHIPFYSKRIDISQVAKERGISTEMAGRDIRYEFFDDLRKELKINKIAIAHNANDQAETLIMRAIRGTGIEGLVGIRPVRDNLFIRPILCLVRSEIEHYCESENLNPRIDESNLEEIYSRNKIRLKAIPFIEENFNKDIVSTLNRLAYSCNKDVELIDSIVDTSYKKHCSFNEGQCLIHKEAFKEMEAIITRIIRKALMEVSQKCNNFEMKHIYDIISLQLGNTGKTINITNGIIVVNEYGNIKIKSNKNLIKGVGSEIKISLEELEEKGQYLLEDEKLGYFKFEVYNLQKGETFPKDNNIKVFDYDKINNIIIRNRKDGDKITPLGMTGSKKLKDILINSKIPRDLRDSIPILVFNEDIGWIVGLNVSNNFKVTKQSKKLLKVTYVRKG